MLVVVGKSKIGLKRFLELLSTQRALPEIVRAVCFSAPTMMQCSVLVDALDDSQIHGNRLELRVAIMFIPEKKRSIRLWYYWNSTLKKLRSWHPVPSVQFSCVRLFVTPWTAAHQASLSITKFQSLLKLISIESVLLYNHFILFNLSQHKGIFRWISSLHQVAKLLEFRLQHQSFQSICRTDFL